MENKNDILSSRIERKYDDYFKNISPECNLNKGKSKIFFPKIIKNYFLYKKKESYKKFEDEIINRKNSNIEISTSRIISNGKFSDKIENNPKEQKNEEKLLNPSKSDYNSELIKNCFSLDYLKTNETNFTNNNIRKNNPQFSFIEKISEGQQTESYNCLNNNDNDHLKTVNNVKRKNFNNDEINFDFAKNANKEKKILLKKINRQQILSNFDPVLLSFKKRLKNTNTEFNYKKFNEYKAFNKQVNNNNCLFSMNNMVNINNYRNFNIFDYKKDYKKFMVSIQQNNLLKYLEEIKDGREKHKENIHNNIINNKNKYNGRLKHTIDFSKFNHSNHKK